jgi:hypothetical protein
VIKLRLVPLGQPGSEVSVPGDSVVLGRDKQCDIVVGTGPKSSISKRHVQLLRGLVLVDLGSTNGTFVEGEKISAPTLLSGGRFNLAGKLDVEVVDEGGPAVGEASGDVPTLVGVGEAGAAAPDLGLVRAELERERARAAALANELAEARAGAGHEGRSSDERAAALEAENADLRRRLDSLKGEIEEREEEGAASLQARLLRQQLEDAQRQNRELATRARGLEERLASRPEGAAAADSAELARLREELERARKAALPPSEFFALLQREIEELRERLKHHEGGGAGSALPVSDLFLQLQAENRELRARLERLGAGAEVPARASPEGARDEELEDLRAAKDRAEAELARLQRERSSGRKAAGPAPRSSAAGGGALRIVALVVEQDVEKLAAEDAATSEEFFVLETLRFLRQAERLVTRIARALVQLLDQHTVLPDMGGENFRSLTKRVLAQPEDAAARRNLAEYLKELSRWLAAVFAAQRKAAVDLALELKQELTEEALTQGRPISALKKVSGQGEAELWKRASDHLKELSQERIEDRLEKLTRHTAQLFLESKEGAS